MKILVVDDNLMFRSMIVEAIKHKYPNAEIVQASNGKEGWEKYKEDMFNGVITDFNMDGMNGLALLTLIKSRLISRLPRNLPAAMISAWNDSQSLRVKVEALGFKFLKKPFKPRELDQLLDDLFKKTEPAE